MLLNIHVKNMALIDEADIDLTEGLNILTGETGAGKSIIIGSVNVALGLAGFKGFAREDAAFALAELVFSVDNEKQRKALEKLDLSLEDDQIIISRRLVNGRSVSKVNGETVPVSLVRQVSEILIDIHGQHEHQALLHQKNHLAILDAFAGEVLSGPAGEVRTLYREYDALDKKLKETDLSETARAKEMDFLAFEVGEIEDAAMKPGEDEALEQAYRRQVNSQRIMEGVTEAETLTGSDFGGAAELVSRAYRSLSNASAYDEKLESITAELADIDNLLNDFHRELKDYQESISFDAESFQQTEDRLNLLNHLKAKYGAAQIADEFRRFVRVGEHQEGNHASGKRGCRDQHHRDKRMHGRHLFSPFPSYIFLYRANTISIPIIEGIRKLSALNTIRHNTVTTTPAIAGK